MDLYILSYLFALMVLLVYPCKEAGLCGSRSSVRQRISLFSGLGTDTRIVSDWKTLLLVLRIVNSGSNTFENTRCVRSSLSFPYTSRCPGFRSSLYAKEA